MGKFTKQPRRGRGAATGVFSSGYVETKGLVLAPQVGLEPTTLRLTAERLASCLALQEPGFLPSCGKSEFRESLPLPSSDAIMGARATEVIHDILESFAMAMRQAGPVAENSE